MSGLLWVCSRCGCVGFHSEACIAASSAERNAAAPTKVWRCSRCDYQMWDATPEDAVAHVLAVHVALAARPAPEPLDRERLARALRVAVRQPGWGIEDAAFDARLIADAYEAEP